MIKIVAIVPTLNGSGYRMGAAYEAAQTPGMGGLFLCVIGRDC